MNSTYAVFRSGSRVKIERCVPSVGPARWGCAARGYGVVVSTASVTVTEVRGGGGSIRLVDDGGTDLLPPLRVTDTGRYPLTVPAGLLLAADADLYVERENIACKVTITGEVIEPAPVEPAS